MEKLGQCGETGSLVAFLIHKHCSREREMVPCCPEEHVLQSVPLTSCGFSRLFRSSHSKVLLFTHPFFMWHIVLCTHVKANSSGTRKAHFLSRVSVTFKGNAALTQLPQKPGWPFQVVESKQKK